MQRANEEALRHAHTHVSPEHILLGLVAHGEGIAAVLLAQFGLDLRTARLEVEKAVPAGGNTAAAGQLPLTPHARKIIDYATEEARTLQQDYLGTEHLLLGLLREIECVPSVILGKLGVSLAAVRRALDALPAVEEKPDPNPSAGAPAETLAAKIERLTRAKAAALAALDYDKAARLHVELDELKQQQRVRGEGVTSPAAPVSATTEAAMYERFTGQARRVLLLAHREAHRFGHDYLGTEHVLLGVLQENAGAIGQLLTAFALDIIKVRQQVEKTVQPGSAATVGAKLPLTPPVRRALDFARDEASRLHHEHVGPEHLLLGLLHEPESEAVQVLLGLDLDLERLRAEVRKLPPPENRDVMLQPEPKPGGAVAADPTAREVAQLVAADLGAAPPIPSAPGRTRRPLRKTPSAEPLLSSDRDGLALQLRVTQHTLGGLAGMAAGGLLGGPGGAVAGLLAGLAVAAVRNRVLAITAGVCVGLALSIRQQPGSLATHLVAVFAGILIGACLGETWSGRGGEESIDDEESPTHSTDSPSQ
jgi:hypothetical protein